MPANLENSAVATGLEKVNFYSNPKERQCQRMLIHSEGDQSLVSLEGMMLKLKLLYFEHLMQSVDSLEKTLMLGGIGGRRRRGWQRMRWLDAISDLMDWVWVNSGWWWLTGRPGVLGLMGSQRFGHDWATELNWTDGTRCHDPSFLNVEL